MTPVACPIAAGSDQILLCSDGLTEMVADTEIGEELSEAPTPADACQRLVNLANRNDGRDNVTVVVSRYRISNNAE